MAFPQVGDTAPDFETQTDTGEPTSLSDYRGKTVVLYFYPKADTPGCTKQACAIRDNYSEYEKRDVVVLGASIDTPEEQAAFKHKFNLPFTLLADADHRISELYGVWGEHTVTRPSGETATFTGLRRSTLILDENGKVISARWGVDPANDTAEILEILDNLEQAN
jgi:thioredoxin-dependent peroxiredoxin